jgi:hypothetical protein
MSFMTKSYDAPSFNATITFRGRWWSNHPYEQEKEMFGRFRGNSDRNAGPVLSLTPVVQDLRPQFWRKQEVSIHAGTHCCGIRQRGSGCCR